MISTRFSPYLAQTLQPLQAQARYGTQSGKGAGKEDQIQDIQEVLKNVEAAAREAGSNAETPREEQNAADTRNQAVEGNEEIDERRQNRSK